MNIFKVLIALYAISCAATLVAYMSNGPDNNQAFLPSLLGLISALLLLYVVGKDLMRK